MSRLSKTFKGMEKKLKEELKDQWTEYRFEEFKKRLKTTKALIKTSSSKHDGPLDSPRRTPMPPPAPPPPPSPPKPPGAGPEDDDPKGSKKGKEKEKAVAKSKTGSKDGSKKKSKKGSADGWDPSSSSSSSSSSDNSSSGDESEPEKKENKKKRELSDSDGERFSLGDLRIERRWRDADLSADAPKYPQFVKPTTFDADKDGKPSYWQWTRILQHFLEYHINTWRKDKNIIMTVGSFMKDTARDWFDARDEQMRKLRIVEIGRAHV